MNKQTLHHLHQLLDNALYLSMDGDKLPDHMKGVQEALVLIKAELNHDDFESKHECEQCEEMKEIEPSFDPIYGKTIYWICDECNENNYQSWIEGEM